MPMNPEIKAQWVAALRSGEYKQGKHVLHNADENTYCCLGVLCELAVRAGLEMRVNDSGNATFYDDKHCTLPGSVMTWTELDEELPDTSVDMYTLAPEDYDEGELLANLASLNDLGWSFEDIANLVEAEF